jgi:YebC/PmpR family DNA-binding regulatory protein
MGAQWKQKGRVENASKRGQIISRAVKEIIIAAKAGDPDPANNAKLRAAVESAKKQSVPRDNIERAIKKGAGLLEPVNYELVTFEGYSPHKVPVIVECLTDNRNRTSSDVRALFRKGALGASGSVAFLFSHLGMIVGTHADTSQDAEEVAIEVGAQEVEKVDDGVQFLCEKSDLISVTKALTEKGWQISASEFTYVPKDPMELSGDARKEVEAFLSEIDDNDDVQKIFAALK